MDIARDAGLAEVEVEGGELDVERKSGPVMDGIDHLLVHRRVVTAGPVRSIIEDCALTTGTESGIDAGKVCDASLHKRLEGLGVWLEGVNRGVRESTPKYLGVVAAVRADVYE